MEKLLLSQAGCKGYQGTTCIGPAWLGKLSIGCPQAVSVTAAPPMPSTEKAYHCARCKAQMLNGILFITAKQEGWIGSWEAMNSLWRQEPVEAACLGPLSTKEIEFITKTFPQSKLWARIVSQVNSIKHLKKKNTNLQKLAENRRGGNFLTGCIRSI